MSNHNKIVKLAVIRENDGNPCPFGLDIPAACSQVGDTIAKMAPTTIMGEDSSEEEQKEIAKANNHLFKWNAKGHKCPYANQVFENNVVCQFGEHGDGTSPIVGSPFYYKHFSGIGLDGLYSYPLGYYSDNSIDRGMYYGMYSIESTGSDEPTNKK